MLQFKFFFFFLYIYNILHIFTESQSMGLSIKKYQTDEVDGFYFFQWGKKKKKASMVLVFIFQGSLFT